MSIDWASVNWGYVALLSEFTFIAALVANFMTFRHRFAAAILAAVLVAAIFMLTTYYPHGIALPTLK
jgi:MFS superfamily sulfate permease-like transporter